MFTRYRGLWFPLTLTVLLLLTVPGLVLLALTLLGRAGTVNAWLQANLGLSYHNPLPWPAALALLLAPFLLLLLYFLRLKRKPLQVPSTFLWRKSIEDLHVNSLFQWLRDNVLLLMQLFIVLLLIYSVMAFQLHGQQGAGRHYILLIDNSASMMVNDVEPTRLAVAKREALAVLDAHTDQDVGMVIEFNSRASILRPYTSDRALLRRAVEQIVQTSRPTRIEEALTLAESLANPRQSTDDAAVRPADQEPGKERTYVAADGIAAEVHLFSDGRFADAGEFALGNLDLIFHRIGAPGPEAVDNVGLVTLNALRDEDDPSRLQVFARVLNYRPAPAKVRLQLEARVAGQPDFTLHHRALTLEPRTYVEANAETGESAIDRPGEGVAVFSLPGIDDAAETRLHARLLDVTDRFPVDDEAWLVVGLARKARVLIVTNGNDILSNFFDQEATQQVAGVQYLRQAELPTDAYRRPAREGAYDLVIFDRCAPASEDELPIANTFFVGDVPPPWRKSDLPPLENTAIRNPTSRHPLMRDLVGLDEIAFAGAFRFDLKDARVPPRTPRLLETDRESAVLFALARRSFTDLVLAFPLVNDRGEWATTWNLKLSFPIFLRNVLYQLGQVRDASAEESVRPGQVAPLRPDAPVRRVEVTAPNGTVERLERTGPGEFLFKDTDAPGVYRVQWESGERGFAVNLLDADESNIQPRDAVQVGAQELAAAPPRNRTRETWKWIALAALAAVVLEWAYYHRRLG